MPGAAMTRLGARLGVMLLALGLLALVTALPASAQRYEQALAGFAADAFGETDAAIAGVASSGHPLAAKIIAALQDGRLLFNPEDKKVYVREPGGHLLDAADGKTLAGASPPGLKVVRLNNRLRRSVEAALGSLTLRAPDPKQR